MGRGTSPSTLTEFGCTPFKRKAYDHLLAFQSGYRKPTSTQQVPSLPPGFVGTVFTSEIRVAADGDFVYGVNRLSDTICVFKVGHDGRLTQESHASTLGDYPRIITIDPSGQFMVAGNQRADNVTTFRVNPGNGKLKFTGDYTAVGSPSGLVYLI